LAGPLSGRSGGPYSKVGGILLCPSLRGWAALPRCGVAVLLPRPARQAVHPRFYFLLFLNYGHR